MLAASQPDHSRQRVTPVQHAQTNIRHPQAGDDITIVGLRILISVSREGSQTVASLANDLDLQESAIAANFPRLVARGLVIGIPSNESTNKLAIILSTAGKRFVDNLISWRPSRAESSSSLTRPAVPNTAAQATEASQFRNPS
jgi:DNA-binding MarR family transcriptional regulator